MPCFHGQVWSYVVMVWFVVPESGWWSMARPISCAQGFCWHPHPTTKAGNDVLVFRFLGTVGHSQVLLDGIPWDSFNNPYFTQNGNSVSTFRCWKRSLAPHPPPKFFWVTTGLHLVCIWFLVDRKLHSSSTADTSIQCEEKKRVAVLGQGWRLQRSQLDWAISIHAIWSFVFQDRLLHPESWHSSPYWERGGVEILNWPAITR